MDSLAGELRRFVALAVDLASAGTRRLPYWALCSCSRGYTQRFEGGLRVFGRLMTAEFGEARD